MEINKSVSIGGAWIQRTLSVEQDLWIGACGAGLKLSGTWIQFLVAWIDG